MELFRSYLRQEFMQRASKNKSYCLRTFAQNLGVNRTTLSSLLSGKRKISKTIFYKMASNLNLKQREIDFYLKEEIPSQKNDFEYVQLQQDTFARVSDWYYDAILEMCRLEKFELTPDNIAEALDLTELHGKMALSTLLRLELIEWDGKKYVQTHNQSTKILDPESSRAANLKYQKQILEKSIKALQKVDRKKRDHSSITMAIDTKDLCEVKELIKKFRRDLNSYLQKGTSCPDEIYQLQISFFPLSNISRD